MKAVSCGNAKKHSENLHRQTQERPASSHKKEQDKYPDKRHFTAEDVIEIYRRKATKTHETSTLLAKKYGVSCNAIRDVWNHNTWVAETMPYWTPEEREDWIRLQREPGKEEKKRKRITGASRSSSESQVAQTVQHRKKAGRTKAVEHLKQTTRFPPPHDLRDESIQDSMDFRNTPSHRSSQQKGEGPPAPCSSSSRMGSHFQSLLAPAGADAQNWFEFNCTYSTSSTSAGYTASGGTSLSSGVLQGGSVGDSASTSTGPNNEVNLVSSSVSSSSVRLSPEEETETHGFEDLFGYQL